MEDSLKAILILCVAACASVILNITTMRQILCFIYLSFIPGYLFLKILSLDNIDNSKKFVFSFALSIAFLMFTGLLVNEMFLSLSLSGPLSTIPLLTTISGMTIILFMLNCRNKGMKSKTEFFEKLGNIDIIRICLLSMLAFLGIVGALYQITALLLIMVVGVAALCVISVFSDRLTPRSIFPWIVVSVSVALIFHSSLVSQHLMGSQDVFSEFYVFRLTEAKGFWLPPGTKMDYSLIDNLESLLSISILPTIYTTILGIDGELFFKLFYPLVLSLLPLALYTMYKEQTGRRIAILSVFFYMSNPIVFYGLEPLSLSRQVVAQLFFVLAISLIIENKLEFGRKKILLIVFGAALIISHYSIALIFLFYITLLFVVSRLGVVWNRAPLERTLSPVLILLMYALTFSWYFYVSNSPINQLLNSVNHIGRWFTADLFSAEARLPPQLSPLSPTASSSLIGTLHKALIYLDHFFIGVGILVLTVKPKVFSLRPKFRLVAIISTAILVLCFVVPNLAPTLNMTRVYALATLFLAPFFALGGTFLFRTLGKFAHSTTKRVHSHLRNLELVIVAGLLAATLLFQIGFVNHVTGGYPYSYSLDLKRREDSSDLSVRITTHKLYFLDQEVKSATWLLQHGKARSAIYADSNSQVTVLKSYALLPEDRMLTLTNGTILGSRTYVYLKYLNVRIGVVSADYLNFVLNMSEMSGVLEQCDKVYSNGGSDVCFVP